MQVEEKTDVIIGKLLGLGLTKFSYGFVLGLKDHEPTKEQSDILRSITIRYPTVFAPTETKKQNDHEHANAGHIPS